MFNYILLLLHKYFNIFLKYSHFHQSKHQSYISRFMICIKERCPPLLFYIHFTSLSQINHPFYTLFAKHLYLPAADTLHHYACNQSCNCLCYEKCQPYHPCSPCIFPCHFNKYPGNRKDEHELAADG